MLKANKKEIRKILSKDRFEGYFRRFRSVKGRNCSLLDAYVYYSWNTALSESLYASLQTLEVTLRNSIHNAANKHFSNPYWFKDQAIFDAQQIGKVRNAESSLRQQRKNIDPGRIIAELNFGFWTGLFKAKYETPFWRPIIKSVFPNMRPQDRTRQKISKKLHRIRILRNRIYHYEPIWYYNLTRTHDEILEMISWISPPVVDLLKPVDRFPIRNTQAEFDKIKEDIRTLF